MCKKWGKMLIDFGWCYLQLWITNHAATAQHRGRGADQCMVWRAARPQSPWIPNQNARWYLLFPLTRMWLVNVIRYKRNNTGDCIANNRHFDEDSLSQTSSSVIVMNDIHGEKMWSTSRLTRRVLDSRGPRLPRLPLPPGRPRHQSLAKETEAGYGQVTKSHFLYYQSMTCLPCAQLGSPDSFQLEIYRWTCSNIPAAGGVMLPSCNPSSIDCKHTNSLVIGPSVDGTCLQKEKVDIPGYSSKSWRFFGLV